MRVLVVDDSEMLREILCAMIERLGHEAMAVGDGAAALAAPPCDFVLLDFELPDASGPDVARALRGRGFKKPIYGLTAHDDAATACRDAGMDGCLGKPFQRHDIAAALGMAKAHDALGDSALVRKMMEGVARELPKLLARAHETTDAATLHRLAHTIRGGLRFLDAPRAQAAAAALEESAKNGAADPGLLAELQDAGDEVLGRLAKLLG